MASSFIKWYKIIGAATSLGQPRPGVELTPSILQSELIETLIHPDRAKWAEVIKEAPYIHEDPRKSPIRNMEEIGEYNRKLYNSILSHINSDDFLLTIGGNHSIASTTISALLKVHRSNLAVIWIDAHGDCNSPLTSPSGNYHGMPLAHVLGLFRTKALNWGQDELKVDQVAMIGIRDLDPEEKLLMDKHGIVYFTSEQVKIQGMLQVMEKVVKHIDPCGTRMVHLSLDVDGIDPSIIPGTGTTSPNGLTLEDYQIISSNLRKFGNRFRSMDLVEINFEIEKEKTLKIVKEILKTTFNSQ